MRGDAAAAGRAAMDGDELAEDVASGRSRAASARRGTSGPAASGRSRRAGTPRCRRRASVAAVDDRATRRSCSARPIRTCGPIDGVRADRRAGADHRAPDRRSAVGWIDDAGSRSSAITSVASATTWSSTSAWPRDAGDRAALGDQPHLQADAIAGHDLAAELDAVDAAQRGARLERLAVAVEQQDRRGLGQRLDHQHARHQRRAREMALEEVFADRDVLDRLERAAALVRDDGIHQRHRVAIGQPVERERGDGGHWDARTGGRRAPRRPARTGPARTGPGRRGGRPGASATSSARPRRRRRAS